MSGLHQSLEAHRAANAAVSIGTEEKKSNVREQEENGSTMESPSEERPIPRREIEPVGGMDPSLAYHSPIESPDDESPSEPAVSPKTHPSSAPASATTYSLESYQQEEPTRQPSPFVLLSPKRLHSLTQPQWSAYLGELVHHREIKHLAPDVDERPWWKRIWRSPEGESPWPCGTFWGIQHILAMILMIFIIGHMKHTYCSDAEFDKLAACVVSHA